MENYEVKEVRHLTQHCYVLSTERKDMQFQAGQCVNIGLVGQGINREYSLYSGEKENCLEFLIKEVEDGSVSPGLKKLNKGDFVEIDGPYGLFTLKEPQNTSLNYLFIGTGTGIAPYHSFVKTFPNLNYRIIHGIRFANESYEHTDYKKGSYTSCVSREKAGDFYGRLTEYLKKIEIPEETICYLCGNRMMIAEAFDILIQKGINGDNIFTEVFF